MGLKHHDTTPALIAPDGPPIRTCPLCVAFRVDLLLSLSPDFND